MFSSMSYIDQDGLLDRSIYRCGAVTTQIIWSYSDGVLSGDGFRSSELPPLDDIWYPKIHIRFNILSFLITLQAGVISASLRNYNLLSNSASLLSSASMRDAK